MQSEPEKVFVILAVGSLVAISTPSGSYGLKADGTVVALHDYLNIVDYVADPPAGLNQVVAISGWANTAALKADGTVVAWGYNSEGECNVPSGLSGVTAISMG